MNRRHRELILRWSWVVFVGATVLGCFLFLVGLGTPWVKVPAYGILGIAVLAVMPYLGMVAFAMGLIFLLPVLQVIPGGMRFLASRALRHSFRELDEGSDAGDDIIQHDALFVSLERTLAVAPSDLGQSMVDERIRNPKWRFRRRLLPWASADALSDLAKRADDPLSSEADALLKEWA